MFIELHQIQSFAPSNLNRDDTNNPKDCEFGGARRARISSQCIKRSIREAPVFTQTTAVENAVRTRWMTKVIGDRLLPEGKDPEDVRLVTTELANAFAGEMDKKSPERTQVLVFLSPEERNEIVAGLLNDWEAAVKAVRNPEDKNAQKDSPIPSIVAETIKNTRNRTSAPDIALFGRMLASKPEVNLEAACQVAHAISTHRVSMEIDFFTAVEELPQDDSAGSAMMGVTAYNSACFYRYARVDWNQLVRNLDGDTGLARRTLEAFLRAAVQAVPTGKQNSFAAQNPPSFLLAVTRQDGMSWSLANAFETPVRPDRESGLVKPSIQALDAYWGRLERVYGGDGTGQIRPVALLVEDGDLLQNLADAQVDSLESWIDSTLAGLPQE